MAGPDPDPDLDLDPRAPFELDLRELELDRAVELTTWVDAIREHLRTHARVRVRGCPQMLAHTLYKVGMLRDDRLQLVDTREEEPYG